MDVNNLKKELITAKKMIVFFTAFIYGSGSFAQTAQINML
jgi:hypothetical protein